MPYQKAKELADHFNVRFLETSAKESLNVEDAFTTMTREIKGKVSVTNNSTKRNAHEASTKIRPGAKKIQGKKSGGCC